jgi:hypothetical protein
MVSVPDVGSMISAGGDYTWNQKNYDLQSKIFRYQKKLQQTIFDREDSAYQRKVKDLQAAGLNKVLAASGSGSAAGSPISVKAPQLGKFPKFNLGSMSFPDQMDIMQRKANIDMTNAQAKLINMQKAATRVGMEMKKFDLDLNRLSGVGSNASEFGKWFKEILGSTQKSGISSELHQAATELKKAGNIGKSLKGTQKAPPKAPKKPPARPPGQTPGSSGGW